MIVYFIAIIAYAPIAVFAGNRYIISMVSLEAVFAGLGSQHYGQSNTWQIVWIGSTLLYSIWHWLYKVVPVS